MALVYCIKNANHWENGYFTINYKAILVFIIWGKFFRMSKDHNKVHLYSPCHKRELSFFLSFLNIKHSLFCCKSAYCNRTTFQ